MKSCAVIGVPSLQIPIVAQVVGDRQTIVGNRPVFRQTIARTGGKDAFIRVNPAAGWGTAGR